MDTNFYYNGKFSSDLGIYLVSMDSGLQTSPFLSDREIQSEKIKGNDVPYVYGVSRSPLRKTLTFSCLDEQWTFEKRREVANWMDSENFQEFYTLDEPNKKYYFMRSGNVDLTYDAKMKGYITVDMVNISPYTYSQIYTKSFSTNGTFPYQIEISNDGDNPLFPELQITKINDGDLSIVNTSNGNKEFKFTGLLNGEILNVSNLYRDITTNLTNTLRYDNFNQNYLELVKKNNVLQVTGGCQLVFSYQFEFKG